MFQGRVGGGGDEDGCLLMYRGLVRLESSVITSSTYGRAHTKVNFLLGE